MVARRADPCPPGAGRLLLPPFLALALAACGLAVDPAEGGRASAGAEADRALAAGPAGAPGPAAVEARITAWATGSVEIFVNGVRVASGGLDGAVVPVGAALVPGARNAIVLRAGAGTSPSPALLGEVHGAFGRAGTSTRWKVKAAAGGEATDPTGPWARAGFDDAAWGAGAAAAASPPAAFPQHGPAQGVWAAGSRAATVLARLELFVPAALDAERPQGFGHAATGGAGGAVVRPATLAELASALCGTRSGSTCTDATPRVVEIAREFDFVGSEGTRTAPGCHGYTVCGGSTASEILLDTQGACAGKPIFDVTYDAAGTDPLLVGSNKTLLGVGSGARIRGKGLAIRGGVGNVVVRNVTITDLNPQVVWGGDAISIDDADRVWIDHNRISLVGRQMLVTGFGKASNVTFSWNELDGRTPYAAYCDGAHYWVSLNLGSADTITLLGNWIHHTSGRGPHVGGHAGVDVLMHLVNNAYESVTGHAINPLSTTAAPQARVVAEGNHFAAVKQPVMIDAASPGLLYAPVSDASACQESLGRSCAANVATPAPSSGWPPPLDAEALSAVGSAGTGAFPAAFPASEVPNVVPHLAGVGHIGARARAGAGSSGSGSGSGSSGSGSGSTSGAPVRGSASCGSAGGTGTMGFLALAALAAVVRRGRRCPRGRGRGLGRGRVSLSPERRGRRGGGLGRAGRRGSRRGGSARGNRPAWSGSGPYSA